MRTSKQRGFFLADEELYSVICSHINKEYSVKVPYQLGAQQKIDTGRPDQRRYAGVCGRGLNQIVCGDWARGTKQAA